MQNRDYFLLMHLSLLFSMSRECTQPRKGRRDGGGGGLLLSRAYPEENVVMSSIIEGIFVCRWVGVFVFEWGVEVGGS